MTAVGLAKGAGMVALGFGLASLRKRCPVGYWRSGEGQEAYLDAYAAAMRELPDPDATLDLRTSYGIVRGYRFDGPGSGLPVVLIPGARSGVPMWAANLALLQRARTVFAFDALGDAGLSVQTRSIADPGAQCAWLRETLAASGIDRAHLVGHSFGGWTAANYAARDPGRVATLSLLDPVYVWAGLPLSMIINSIPATVPFLPKSWRDAAMARIGGTDSIDLTDPVTRMITLGSTHYQTASAQQPAVIGGEQLGTTPVYAALADGSVMHDSAALAEVARRTTANATVEVWPDTSHSLPMEAAEPLTARVLAYQADHE